MLKYILLGLYVIVILYAGIVNRKNANSTKGFFLGDGDVGPIMSAFAFVTTYISAVAIVNAGKIGWTYGVGVMFNAFGNVFLGIFLCWLILGKKTRLMTQRLNTMTMPDFLRVRYDSNAFKLFGAILIFVFMVPYSGSVFMGLSYMFETIFHIPYQFALISMTILTGIYLTMGGYKAVALADSIQGIIMMIGAILIAVFIWTAPEVGGPVEGIRRLAAIDPKLTSLSWNAIMAALPVILLTSLGPLGMPQMVQKFFAIKDAKSVIYAMVVCTIAGFVIVFGMHLIGLYNHLFFQTLPIDPGTLKPNADLLSPQMFEMFLPQIVIAVIFLMIISASMSTLAGLVMVAASSISMDLLKGYLKPEMPDKNVTRIMQALCVVFVMFSLVIAINKPTSVLTLMSVSWGAISGFFLAPYLYGVLWRGTTRAGAYAGGIIGFLLAIILPFVFKVNPSISTAYALIIPLFVVPIVSWVTPKFTKEHVELCFTDVKTALLNEEKAA